MPSCMGTKLKNTSVRICSLACLAMLSFNICVCVAGEPVNRTVGCEAAHICAGSEILDAEIGQFLVQLKALTNDDRLRSKRFYETEIFKNILPMRKVYGDSDDQRVTVRAVGIAYANYFHIADPPESEANLSTLDKISADDLAMWLINSNGKPQGYISFLLRENMIPFSRFVSVMDVACKPSASTAPHPSPAATAPNGSIQCAIDLSDATQVKTMIVNTFPNGAVNQVAFKTAER